MEASGPLKTEAFGSVLEFVAGAACGFVFTIALAIAAHYYMPNIVSQKHLEAQRQLLNLPEVELFSLRSVTMSEEFAVSLDNEALLDDDRWHDFRTITFGEANQTIICSPNEDIIETGILVWSQSGPSIAMPNNPQHEFLVLKLCSIRI